jgi:membrane protein
VANLKTVMDFLKETISEWSEDKAARLAAALSYYAIFSIAPLLIIAIAIAGFFLGRVGVNVRQDILLQVQGVVGEKAAGLVGNLIDSISSPRASLIATIAGTVTILVGATGVYGQLQQALNTIWEVEPKPGGGIVGVLWDKFLTFVMVLGTGFMILLFLSVSTGLSTLGGFFSNYLPFGDIFWQVLNFVFSFGVLTLLFAFIFKFLPEVKIEWSDVWIGALVTALLFTIGKYLIGLYLGYSSITSTYRAVGSLVVILLWVYYSAQIFFFGAEFTQVYARRYGSRIRPGKGAVSKYEERRAQRRIPREVQFHMRKEEHSRAHDKIAQQDSREQSASITPKKRAYLGYTIGFGVFIGLLGFIWNRLRGKI